MPSFTRCFSNGVPFRSDCPTIVWFQPRSVFRGVETDHDAVHDQRPVVAAADVVLARPDHLDRRVDAGLLHRLRDVHGLHQVIGRRDGAPAEAAAGQHRVQRDLLRLEPGGACDRELIDRLELRAAPHGAAVGLQIDDGIQRLHRRMGQVWKLVGGLDLRRRLRHGIGIAVAACRQSRLAGQFAVLPDKVDCGRAGRGLPLDVQRIAPGLGRPVAAGNHGHAGAAAIDRHLHDGLHALDGTRLGRIEARHLAAEHRRMHEDGDAHVGQRLVDAELSGAIDLLARIQPPGRLADEEEVAGIGLQSDTRRHRLLGGRVGQRAVAGAPFLSGQSR